MTFVVVLSVTSMLVSVVAAASVRKWTLVHRHADPLVETTAPAAALKKK
jgi:hypothetical protein